MNSKAPAVGSRPARHDAAGAAAGADDRREAPYPRPAYAWFVVAVLALASVISYIDRQVVAVVADAMKVDLGIGDAQIGLLYGVFAIFYAVAGLPLAFVADRKSRKHLIAAGIFF